MAIIFSEDKEWKLSDLSIVCGESEDDMRVMVGHFVEVRKRRSPNRNADKGKVIVLGGGGGERCVR